MIPPARTVDNNCEIRTHDKPFVVVWHYPLAWHYPRAYRLKRPNRPVGSSIQRTNGGQQSVGSNLALLHTRYSHRLLFKSVRGGDKVNGRDRVLLDALLLVPGEGPGDQCRMVRFIESGSTYFVG